uniref:Uncharacterized protein n=1 Tax=Polytomella parva TaxID=51329 RepID=A0A7S0V4R7_9CHLO
MLEKEKSEKEKENDETWDEDEWIDVVKTSTRRPLRLRPLASSSGEPLKSERKTGSKFKSESKNEISRDRSFDDLIEAFNQEEGAERVEEEEDGEEEEEEEDEEGFIDEWVRAPKYLPVTMEL